jgi:hypothetical protein
MKAMTRARKCRMRGVQTAEEADAEECASESPDWEGVHTGDAGAEPETKAMNTAAGCSSTSIPRAR